MDNTLYRFMMTTAVALTVAWVGWTVYDSFFRNVTPGEYDYFAANNLFEDGEYERALVSYEEALKADPNNVHALRGKARTLLQLKRYGEALAAFDEAITRDPNAGPTYANRGILYDRMGQYSKALADYEHALKLDPEIADGPSWLTRFLRNQPQKPPTIDERARYLREQLALPESERKLRVPEFDVQQRPYKM